MFGTQKYSINNVPISITTKLLDQKKIELFLFSHIAQVTPTHTQTVQYQQIDLHLGGESREKIDEGRLFNYSSTFYTGFCLAWFSQ